jgi:MFS family permease
VSTLIKWFPDRPGLAAGMAIMGIGGGFATVPAYLRDLFGAYQVGAIHGRLLTAWSVAGVAGPLIVNRFLDAQGKPGTLTASAYRPALLTMVGVLAVGSWPTSSSARSPSASTNRRPTRPGPPPPGREGARDVDQGETRVRLGAGRDPAGLRGVRDAGQGVVAVHRVGAGTGAASVRVRP